MKINRSDVSRLFGNKYRIECFEEGFTFHFWKQPRDTGLKAQCTENPMYMHGENYLSYTVSIPRPRAPECLGFGIVTRTSAHRYKAALANGAAVHIDTFESLADIAQFSREFFGE